MLLAFISTALSTTFMLLSPELVDKAVPLWLSMVMRARSVCTSISLSSVVRFSFIRSVRSSGSCANLSNSSSSFLSCASSTSSYLLPSLSSSVPSESISSIRFWLSSLPLLLLVFIAFINSFTCYLRRFSRWRCFLWRLSSFLMCFQRTKFYLRMADSWLLLYS